MDNEEIDNSQDTQKIHHKDEQFILNVFEGVNEFVKAIFETILALYDPDVNGFLEDVEADLTRLAIEKTVQGEIYCVLIVLSQVMN